MDELIRAASRAMFQLKWLFWTRKSAMFTCGTVPVANSALKPLEAASRCLGY